MQTTIGGHRKTSAGMHAVTSRFSRLLLIALCAAAADAVADDDGPGTIGRGDCRVVNPNPRPNERVEWSGTCKGGFAQGEGVLEWYIGDVLSSRYRGTLADGRPDGTGDYEFLQANARYEGEFREGKRHGQGKLTEPSGRVIAGRFDRGEPSGDVTVTGPGSMRYEGGWQQGRPQGQGRIAYNDGATYEGGFERGLREGRGRLVDAAGTVYEGVFSAGLLNGEGRYHYRNGADYVGAFLNAKPHGRGVAVYTDGVRYEGEFRFGLREGPGTLVTPQGRSLQGDWLANEFTGQGVEVLASGERREGAFKAGLLSGRATVRTPDGASFTGEFAKGLRNGPGVATAPSGLRTEGQWVNGALVPGYVQTNQAGERLPPRPAIKDTRSCAPTAGDYPAESRRRREQGTTRVRFHVDSDGKLSRSEILNTSGYARLDDAALKALSGCAFTPGQDLDGHPVAGSFDVEYVWRLD